MEPHKSEWISSSFLCALECESWMDYLLCFPRIQASHCLSFLGIVRIPLTPYFFNNQRLSYFKCPNIACHKILDGNVPSSWCELNAKFFSWAEEPFSFRIIPSFIPSMTSERSDAFQTSTLPSNMWMECPCWRMWTKDNNFLHNPGRYRTSCRRWSRRLRNLSLIMPSPDGLSLDLSVKYTAPST